jgi:molybdopterin/thiamine biosynthesis adenylyltransferase
MVGFFTWKNQGDAIASLYRSIAAKNNEIVVVRNNISSLSEQWLEKRNSQSTKTIANNTLNAEIRKLSKDIAEQEGILAGLEKEHIRLTDRYNTLDALIKKGIASYSAIAAGAETQATVLTAETSENIRINQIYYTDIQSQNEILSNTARENRAQTTTYERRNDIENKNIMAYSLYGTLLFYIYYVILALLLYIIYSKQLVPNVYLFIAMAILLGGYPFYILMIEELSFKTFRYTWALMRGVPYNEE